MGIGCRLPGAVASPDALVDFLHTHGDSITEVPKDRWDLDRYYDPNPDAGADLCQTRGFLQEDVYALDPTPSSISAREALRLDPQQRLLLETAWSALEDAFIPAPNLRGSATGLDRVIGSTVARGRVELAGPHFDWVADHRVNSDVLFPGAGYIEAAFAAHAELHGQDTLHTVCNLSHERGPVAAPGGETCLEVDLAEHGGLSLRSCQDGTWTTHAKGRVPKRALFSRPEARTKLPLPTAPPGPRDHVPQVRDPGPELWPPASAPATHLALGRGFRAVRPHAPGGLGGAALRR